MMVCCASTLEFVESLVEVVYMRHSPFPFNEMAQEHRTGHRRNWGRGARGTNAPHYIFYLTVMEECK
jgi:hypothetical protein